MIVRQHLVHRTYHDVLVEQHGDTITNRIEAVQIVRHHDNGEAEAVVQPFDEFVVVGRADRVEAGGRLVQEQQLWSRASARARLARLRMPPESSEGFLSPVSGGRPTRATLRAAMSRMVCSSSPACSRIGTMMFSDTDSEEKQGTVLELHAGAALYVALGLPVQLASVLSQDFDGALGRVVEADDGAQQHGFAGPRSTHKADNLATKYVEIEVVVDDVVAELRAHATQPEHHVAAVAMVDQLSPLVLSVFGHQTFASRKMIENMASSTMTQKIDSTTERVVSWPTLSALPRTWRPSKQPIVAITAPNTGALIMPV